MKRFLLTAFSVVLLINIACAQSGNSNIGTEFWTGWMDHIDPATGTGALSQMNLYIASDVATTGTVSLADGSYTATFSVVPNKITIFAVPASAFLGNINGTQSKGIHITSIAPIAVYAHIYASAVSGATLLLPVNTLANDYYSLNYNQLSNSVPSYSLFMVVATVDNTTVQITPTAALIDGSAAGKTFTVTLNKGQVYQGISLTDLTGTHIASVSNGTSGCQKIAVFSGSNKIYIGTPNKTSDNLFQQVYPTASWGKLYITVPLKDRNYDIIRIVLSDPTANVTVNGTKLTTAQYINGFYYDFKSQTTNYITSDKPIQVVQYAVTQGNTIGGTTTLATDVGDPEMIFLNPLEQTIDHVTLYSANEFAILKSYINVVVPTSAVSSFLLDGALTTSSFTVVPGNTAYSYAQFNVTSGATHTIAASQGFNAIAYGFGNPESYGYAAGTNVKNLNEYVQYSNPITKQVITSGCTGTSIYPQVVLPYQTTSITWDLGNGVTPVVQNLPNPTSSFVKNGVTLYLYDYGTPISYAAGTYAIKVTVVDPITTACGSNEEVDLSFTVANPPTAKFSSRDSICVGDTIGFKDQSLGNGSAIQSWKWSFGTGDTAIIQNPVYKYLVPGDYTTSLTVTIPTGCQDIFTKKIHVRAPSVAAFNTSAQVCETLGITLTDKSSPTEGKITQWIWNYGDGTPTETRTNGLPFTHIYAKAGTDTIKLTIVTDKGCFSPSVSKVVTVHPHPVVAFALPDVCLANAIAQFTDQTTIADNSSAQFTYIWNFGDSTATVANPNTSTLKNPTHQFTRAGTYPVSLTVTSKDSCSISLIKNFTVSGQANFTAAATACPGDTVLFTDKTDGTNKIVSAWHWSFGNGDTSLVQNPKYAFKTAGDYQVVLTVTGHNGCSTTSFTKAIHINQKPVSSFINTSPTCETKTVTFTDKSISAEGTIVAWNWDFGDGTPNSNLQNPVHAFKPFNTYTVKLTVTSSLGCLSTVFSKQIIVHPQPIVAFTLPDICLANSNAQFTDKTTIADNSNALFTYIWNFGDAAATTANPNISTAKNPTHIFTVAGTYPVTLTVMSKDSCSTSLTQNFLVSGQAKFTAQTTACPADTVMFTDKTDGTNKAVSSWHWDFGTGDTSAVQNPKYAFKTPGDYLVVLTVRGHNGCSTTSFSQSIHINKKPTASFKYSTPTCETQTITFTDTSTPNEGTLVAWLWDFGDGTLSNLQNPTHVFNPFKTYTVRLTVTTSVGCSSVTANQQVIVNPQPVASFFIPDVCASDGNATFTANADKNAVKYTWFFGNTLADINSGNVTTATGITVTHPISTAGYYYAKLTVLTAAGCTSDTTKQYRVNGSSPIADFSVAPNNGLCSSQEVIFIDKATVPGFGDDVTSVDMYYDFANNPTVKTHYERPTYGQALRHLYPLENSVSHTYTVHMVAYSGTTCFSMKDITITVLPVPAVTFTALPNVCQNSGILDLTKYAMATGPSGTGVFYLDGTTSVIAAGKFDPLAVALGTHTVNYIYTASSAGACADTLKQTITVAPVPTVSAGPAQEVIAGESVTLQAKATVGSNIKYLWTPSTGLSDPTILNPVATPLVDTKYTLTVTLTTGSISCPVSDTVTVRLLRVPIIPNTFTPNGDNINDTWEIKYLNQYPACTVKVFNRAGQMVYSTVGYQVPWDGKYLNSVLPVGTYYYIIDPKHNLKIMSGSVNLIR